MQMARSILANRGLFVVILGFANLAFWLVPSNVVELVAREQQVLLGHYSRTRFAWLLAAAIASLLVIWLHPAGRPQMVRRRVFILFAVLMALVPSLVLADIVLRLRTEYPYAPGEIVYRRPAHRTYRLSYEDAPAVGRSYPRRRPGFGKLDCVLSYDANGFRNSSVPESCEIVALGDSFTEGSRVSDDQAWPAQLAKLGGLRVYNLGISGYSPAEYLASLKGYGLPLRPALVVCMLYEGNDFRSAQIEARRSVSLRQLIKTSPMLMAADELMIRLFGPIGSDTTFAGQQIVSWLPLAYPAGRDARYYAFAPKQLLEPSADQTEFETSEPWFAAKAILREMDAACRSAGARLLIAYAPNKAHVVFPPVAMALPAEEVRSFVGLRSRIDESSDARTFVRELAAGMENRESVVAAWCRRREIPFISLTRPLRECAEAGRQPYYTYDQHWTPLGHEVAARAVHAFWLSAAGR